MHVWDWVFSSFNFQIAATETFKAVSFQFWFGLKLDNHTKCKLFFYYFVLHFLCLVCCVVFYLIWIAGLWKCLSVLNCDYIWVIWLDETCGRHILIPWPANEGWNIPHPRLTAHKQLLNPLTCSLTCQISEIIDK